jgi:two-component system phosphate regulon sensor histidine kinase PhoR
MTARRAASPRSRQLALLLVAIVAIPAATFLWLGLQLLAQDEALATQRALERRQAIGQAVLLSLEQALTGTERLREDTSLPPGIVRVTQSARRITVTPPEGLLWWPVVPPGVPAENQAFADAERDEYQGAPDRALAAYRRATKSPSPAMRAGAWLRIARVERRRHQWDEALAAYRQLAAVTGVAVEGVPADLMARRAICSVLADAARLADLAVEVDTLTADVLAARWMLDHTAWTLVEQELQRWRGAPLDIGRERRALSAAVEIFHREGARAAANLPASGARVLVADGMALTLLTRVTNQTATTLVVSPSVVHAWLDRAAAGTLAEGEQLALLSSSGELVAGEGPAATGATRWQAAETGLPWTLLLMGSNAAALAVDVEWRRRLLLTGLAAVLLLLGGGSVFLWRVVQRELAVARLQTEFVAAVSHEFRTPLTSMQHVTELLDEDDEISRERRRSFYGVLARNTERLHQLVESLLDFARMESGRKPYDLQPLDAATLVDRVVSDFRGHAVQRTVALEVDRAGGDLAVRADATALAHALWNLLDNAVKYSPDGGAIDVSVARQGASVSIAVHDRGLGIPRSEQCDVFERFVRGRQATTLGIAGTGLGLAMVAHIVAAHGGRVDVDSEEGAGSTFRIVLPSTDGVTVPHAALDTALAAGPPHAGAGSRRS